MDREVLDLVNKQATTALLMAIGGLLCCGIILGPLALQKVNETRALMIAHDIEPGPSGTLNAAKVIAIIAIVLFVLNFVFRIAQLAAS